jgi:hypothetical protein
MYTTDGRQRSTCTTCHSCMWRGLGDVTLYGVALDTVRQVLAKALAHARSCTCMSRATCSASALVLCRLPCACSHAWRAHGVITPPPVVSAAS